MDRVRHNNLLRPLHTTAPLLSFKRSLAPAPVRSSVRGTKSSSSRHRALFLLCNCRPQPSFAFFVAALHLEIRDHGWSSLPSLMLQSSIPIASALLRRTVPGTSFVWRHQESPTSGRTGTNEEYIYVLTLNGAHERIGSPPTRAPPPPSVRLGSGWAWAWAWVWVLVEGLRANKILFGPS
ncbi:hypothetical protein F2Q68_00012904 [Brassica cretica]|uniref:Uncharacterized protein n=1 Tax=Brassica cretica TaxID=69181 RepID=A0A8S9HQA4_BRACR|nr:hypothetical protein F2Q68_00012904 [Brassica cretica]